MIREVFLLGNPALYEKSEEVRRERERTVSKNGTGFVRNVSQIGVPKRILYMNTGTSLLFVNPALQFPDGEKREALINCMSLPGLLAKVERYRRCQLSDRERNWNECV